MVGLDLASGRPDKLLYNQKPIFNPKLNLAGSPVKLIRSLCSVKESWDTVGVSVKLLS